MVAIETHSEVAEYRHNGHTYRVRFRPDDMQGEIRRLVSLAERKELSWSIVAALRIAMINKAFPTALKCVKKHKRRIG